MWDERYASDEFAYGRQANEFLQQQVDKLPKGEILSLAEGEGRNAVFLAKLGYSVTAVDSSIVGLEKAQKLAEENGVSIKTIQADLTEFDFGINKWDGIVSIFSPLPSAPRAIVHQRSVQALKPDGVFLIEAYTPAQIAHGTGGGNNPDTMPTKPQLEQELSGLKFELLQELEREVIEGKFHTGLGAVVQGIGRK